MEPVFGVMPAEHICHSHWGLSRRTFGHQVGLLVVVADESLTGGILFGPDQMPTGVESCLPPSRKEPVGLRPPVEADAEGIRLQDSEDFGKGWIKPFRVVV